MQRHLEPNDRSAGWHIAADFQSNAPPNGVIADARHHRGNVLFLVELDFRQAPAYQSDPPHAVALNPEIHEEASGGCAFQPETRPGNLSELIFGSSIFSQDPKREI